MLIGDEMEERARVRLRSKGKTNPSRKTVAESINDELRPALDEMCQRIVFPDKRPEHTWIPILKEEIKNTFSK